MEGGDERRCGGCSTSRERAVKEKMLKRAAASAKSDGARPQVVFRSFQEVYLSAATCNFNFGSARCRPAPRAQPFGTPFRPAPFGTFRGNMKLSSPPPTIHTYNGIAYDATTLQNLSNHSLTHLPAA